MHNHKAIKNAAERFKPVPQKVIRHLIEKEFLSATLDRMRDIDLLAFLQETWGDSTLLRAQLATLPKKRRLSLAETAELNKWETYVFSRYKNASRRLTVTMVAAEVELIFGFKVDGFAIQRIKKIRQKIQNARYYETIKASSHDHSKEGQGQ